MAGDTPSANLQASLEQRCEKVRKPRFTVLFLHGDRTSGILGEKMAENYELEEASLRKKQSERLSSKPLRPAS